MEPKYKQGDKVRIVSELYGHGFPTGTIVRLTSEPGNSSFDEPEINYYAVPDYQEEDSAEGWYVWESEIEPFEETPLDIQVGGNHYKKMKIQPLEFIVANGLNFCEGNIIKYVSRYKSKNGIEDLKKAKHYLDVLIAEVEKE